MSTDILKISEIQAVFYTDSLRRVWAGICTRVQDSGKPAFVMPDAPARATQVQFVAAVDIGDGGTCITMWRASQPVADGRLWMEGLRK
jgi:hypothetical protein